MWTINWQIIKRCRTYIGTAHTRLPSQCAREWKTTPEALGCEFSRENKLIKTSIPLRRFRRNTLVRIGSVRLVWEALFPGSEAWFPLTRARRRTPRAASFCSTLEQPDIWFRDCCNPRGEHFTVFIAQLSGLNKCWGKRNCKRYSRVRMCIRITSNLEKSAVLIFTRNYEQFRPISRWF